MTPFKSVGARLSLALVLVVLLALGIAYAIVVPPLERSLLDSRLHQLTDTASVAHARFPGIGFGDDAVAEVDAWAAEAAAATNSRVVVLAPLSLTEAGEVADSGGQEDLTRNGTALTAAGTQNVQRRIVRRGDHRYAEVAFPIVAGFSGLHVLLFSAPLDDTLANVELVKRRVLAAGLVALFVALVVGYGGAWLFARRIRLLERAADRIAGGELDEPVVDRSSDEVGELARAFERMRGRLAQLEHARREFVANASHELRTPIFSLGGFLELLQDEDMDERTRREFLGAMSEQVERLTRLAGDLLDLSRLDAGRLHVDAEAVDLGTIAEALREEFAPLARTHGHGIALRVDLGAPAALADELKVLQIGRVLVENALRHTAPGTPVQIHVAEEDGAAVLTVQDLGAGIPAEHLPHVFERFYRADGGIATGSGLGLAIARELATLMGGSLRVESRPGRTAFALTLPVATAADRAREPLAGAR